MLTDAGRRGLEENITAATKVEASSVASSTILEISSYGFDLAPWILYWNADTKITTDVNQSILYIIHTSLNNTIYLQQVATTKIWESLWQAWYVYTTRK